MIAFIKWVFVAIKDAVNLNIADLSYLYQPSGFEDTISAQVGVPKPGIIIRIGSFFLHMLNNIWRYPLWLKDYSQNPVFFFAATNNEMRALHALIKKTPNPYFTGIVGFGDHQLPLFWAYFLSIPFFPLVLIKFFRSYGIKRKAFYYVFDAYWVSYGFYFLMRWLFKKNRPVMVVLSNEHVIWTRSIIQAASDENIPTVYLQHASVTEIFPPLTVDYAFLEGIDAAKKYASCGASETVVFLVGIPRFDKYYPLLKQRNSVQTVGVCVTVTDTPEDMIPLCQIFNKNLPQFNFVLRPHPGDDRFASWHTFATQQNWGFSNSKEEDAFHFSNRVDIVVAGDSNILLEAALMNTIPVYYDRLDKQLDWYGFCKNGLVERFSKLDEIVRYLQALANDQFPNTRIKAKYYCSTIDTDYDGRSADIIAHLIEEIIRGEVNTQDWKRAIGTQDLTVYQMQAMF